MIFDLCLAATWGPFLGLGLPWLLARRYRHPVRPNYRLWLLVDAVGAVVDLLPPRPSLLVVAVHLVNAAVAAYLWWRSRRGGRKRAPRAYGAKSRERVARLARSLRDAQRRPRRVWQPQPGGAGW